MSCAAGARCVRKSRTQPTATTSCIISHAHKNFILHKTEGYINVYTCKLIFGSHPKHTTEPKPVAVAAHGFIFYTMPPPPSPHPNNNDDDAKLWIDGESAGDGAGGVGRPQ